MNLMVENMLIQLEKPNCKYYTISRSRRQMWLEGNAGSAKLSFSEWQHHSLSRPTRRKPMRQTFKILQFEKQIAQRQRKVANNQAWDLMAFSKGMSEIQESIMGNKPTHRVFFVQETDKDVDGSDKKQFWPQIGAAWAHQSGKGHSIKLDLISADFSNGDLVILETTEKPDTDVEVQQETA